MRPALLQVVDLHGSRPIAPASQLAHGHHACRENGAMVAMTAGDAGIMARHREEVLRALQQGVDVMFMNQCALCLWHQALRLSVWAKPSVFTVNP